MASSSPESRLGYFGFRDLLGYKDFVVYVLSCAPELFPAEDWLLPDEQMNLERAFVGLRQGLRIVAQHSKDSVVLDRCAKLIDEADAHYRAGRDHAGQLSLEELEKVLKTVRAR